MEIKENELRIGSWVLYKDSREVQITANDFSEIENVPHWCEIFIKAIPLTEEWLVKLGFGEPGKYALRDLKAGHFHLSWEDGNGMFLESIGINIEYVHQLQNLFFTLTGEELIIKA